MFYVLLKDIWLIRRWPNLTGRKPGSHIGIHDHKQSSDLYSHVRPEKATGCSGQPQWWETSGSMRQKVIIWFRYLATDPEQFVMLYSTRHLKLRWKNPQISEQTANASVHSTYKKLLSLKDVTIVPHFSYCMSASATFIFTLTLASLDIACRRWQPFILLFIICNPSYSPPALTTWRYIVSRPRVFFVDTDSCAIYTLISLVGRRVVWDAGSHWWGYLPRSPWTGQPGTKRCREQRWRSPSWASPWGTWGTGPSPTRWNLRSERTETWNRDSDLTLNNTT